MVTKQMSSLPVDYLFAALCFFGFIVMIINVILFFLSLFKKNLLTISCIIWQLGGATKNNDGECHLDDKGSYSPYDVNYVSSL